MRLIRSVSPAMMQDRSLARDMEAMHHLVATGAAGILRGLPRNP